MKYININKIIILAGALAMAGAHADDRLSINGFGYQDYRQANANQYSGADSRGSWDNNFLGIVMSGKASDRDTVWAQVQANSTEQTRITWMFLDHRFNDNLSAHVGRVKFPYGLYNEFIDNKTLQLSAIEPSAYSGAGDMVYDAYNGIGLDWTSGSLFTQIFAGNVYNPPVPTSPPVCSVVGGCTANPPTAASIPAHSDRRLIGGRITWNTPQEGLRFMLSANGTQGESNVVSPTLGQLYMEERAMLSADYDIDNLDIKSEFNYHKIPAFSGGTGVISSAWYVQGGYKIGLWTPYARYDNFKADNRYASDPSYYQKEWVLGVNYKISDNLNARIEDHFIHGYGLPVGAQETPLNGGKTNWNMLAAQVNFMF